MSNSRYECALNFINSNKEIIVKRIIVQKLKTTLACLVIAVAASEATSAPDDSNGYPLMIKHKFGTTVIEKKPERVASVDFGGADNLLALGVQPVAIRDWYGNFPRSVWPWAEALLEGTPAILKGDLNYEKIASTKPDIIIALYSGINRSDYEKLSLIAPVVAVPKGTGDYLMSWDDRALLTGKAIGKVAKAKEKIESINNKLSKIALSHSEWRGKTVSIATASSLGVTVYTSNDIRMRVMRAMGFFGAKSIDDLMKNPKEDFHVELSKEDFSPIDVDLLVWLSFDGNWGKVKEFAARPFLTVTREGRDVYAGGLLAGAFSHGSLLSLPYTINKIVPMIEAALDGDPNTHNDDR
jgi:iron complex transport system substrate-binding protein